MSTFNAVVPKDFDELMFLFWCEDECLESALHYRDQEFLDLLDKIAGKEFEFSYDKYPSGNINTQYCFLPIDIDPQGTNIPCWNLDLKS